MTTVYFGTNRKPNRKNKPDDFTGEFSDDGLANLRFGEADVNLDSERVESIEIYRETQTVFGSQALLDDLRSRMVNEESDTIIFIHGYNVSFKEALISAAKIKARYRVPGRPEINVVTFSWPSNGSAFHYPSDRHDAQASGLALSRGFQKLMRFLRNLTEGEMCRQDLHLVCHSMGNYALRWALQAMREESMRLPRVLKEVILAAADEDDDAFEFDEKFARLPDIGRRVSVYYNRGDTALVLSDAAKGNPDRLGSTGPRKPREVQNKVTIVDCSDVVSGVLEHSYFIDESRVVADIVSVLSGTSSDAIAGREYIHQTNTYRLE